MKFLKNSKLWLTLLTFIGFALSAYLQTKVSDQTASILGLQETLNQKNVIIDDSVTNVKIYYDSLLSEVVNVVVDTIYESVPSDPIVSNVYDTLIVKDTLIQYIEKTKPTWGNISFSDTSNSFVNVFVNVDFPYGTRELTYTNKWKPKYFQNYYGIGVQNRKPAFMTGVSLWKVGVEANVNTSGEVGCYVRFTPN